METLADVRRFPRSRRHPDVNAEALAEALPAEGVAYVHLPELGGRRAPRPDSPNAGWRERGFRGYADHLASEEFARGRGRLEGLARERPTAIMCAEAQWWRCHRRLVADVLVARGWEVEHLAPGGRATPDELPEFARIGADGTVTYPAPGSLF